MTIEDLKDENLGREVTVYASDADLVGIDGVMDSYDLVGELVFVSIGDEPNSLPYDPAMVSFKKKDG